MKTSANYPVVIVMSFKQYSEEVFQLDFLLFRLGKRRVRGKSKILSDHGGENSQTQHGPGWKQIVL